LWRFEKTQQISSPFQEEETGIPAICCFEAVKILLQANSVGWNAVVLIGFVPRVKILLQPGSVVAHATVSPTG